MLVSDRWIRLQRLRWLAAIALLPGCGPQAPAVGESAASTSEGAASTTAGGGQTTSVTASAAMEESAATTTSTSHSTTGSTSAAATTGEPTTDEPTQPQPPDLPPEPPWAPLACETDEFEANDEAMLATAIDAPCSDVFDDDQWYCSGWLDACHALGDHDWYSLPAAPIFGQWTILQMELTILPWSSSCNCDWDPVPTGPELAKTIEIYDAETLSLLGTASSTEQWTSFYDADPQFGAALLIHVVGPADASWAYELWVDRRDSQWEDSCEC